MDDAHKIARAFCGVLNEWLTPEQIQQVNILNATDADQSVCHTHDFCDANQAMLDAMESLGIEWEGIEDLDRIPVNEAWSIAKAAGFSAGNIEVSL